MKKIFISFILCVSMIMTIFISAVSSDTTEDPGMVLNKYYTPVTADSGILTMELKNIVEKTNYASTMNRARR